MAGLSETAKPPTPTKRNLPFQVAGSLISNWAAPSGAPKPVVLRTPSTWQNSGVATDPGTSTAETIVTLGTLSAASAPTLQFGSAASAGAAIDPRPASTDAQVSNLLERIENPPG